MNLHRLDFTSLSLFTLVVRTGSISKGAELAHLAVGAASKRISDLEATVDAELFDRHSRGVTLTAAGEALHRHAQRILHDIDMLAAELSDHAKGVTGVVRLWANTSAITQFMPADLASFSTLHPGIRIQMNEADSHDVVLAVLEGRADRRHLSRQLHEERDPAGDPHRRQRRPAVRASHRMLNGLDDIALTLQRADRIRAFGVRRRTTEPWLFT